MRRVETTQRYSASLSPSVLGLSCKISTSEMADLTLGIIGAVAAIDVAIKSVTLHIDNGRSERTYNPTDTLF